MLYTTDVETVSKAPNNVWIHSVLPRCIYFLNCDAVFHATCPNLTKFQNIFQIAQKLHCPSRLGLDFTAYLN